MKRGFLMSLVLAVAVAGCGQIVGTNTLGVTGGSEGGYGTGLFGLWGYDDYDVTAGRVDLAFGTGGSLVETTCVRGECTTLIGTWVDLGQQRLRLVLPGRERVEVEYRIEGDVLYLGDEVLARM